MKFALATGNFGIKNTFNKQGISQLFNKMSFNSIKSHLRRVNTPIEKCGKLVPLENNMELNGVISVLLKLQKDNQLV